jgi:hypothetical protein
MLALLVDSNKYAVDGIIERYDPVEIDLISA